jgi:hypothetical protein
LNFEGVADEHPVDADGLALRALTGLIGHTVAPEDILVDGAVTVVVEAVADLLTRIDVGDADVDPVVADLQPVGANTEGLFVLALVPRRGVLVDETVTVVVLGVALFGPGFAIAVVASVPFSVTVAVGLVGVGGPGAIVADVAQTVAVGIGLVQVPNPRAVVAGVAETIAVAVALSRAGQVGAVVAGVTKAVAVTVGLVGVSKGGAHITGVTVSVAVTIGLVGVGGVGTPVTDVAPAIAVGVGLVQVWRLWAIVFVVAHRVLVGVDAPAAHGALQDEQGVGLGRVNVPLARRRNEPAGRVLLVHQGVGVIEIPTLGLTRVLVIAGPSSAAGYGARDDRRI